MLHHLLGPQTHNLVHGHLLGGLGRVLRVPRTGRPEVHRGPDWSLA